MLISTKGRYALRVLTDMARHQAEGYVPLQEIARRQGISGKYLESIIKALVRQGIVQGLRGKGGGYRLTLPPEQVTVGSILRLTEDSLCPVACLKPGAASCARSADCSTLPLWQGLNQLIDEYLERHTLADLMQEGTPDDPSAP